jgi:hypothetical protein
MNEYFALTLMNNSEGKIQTGRFQIGRHWSRTVLAQNLKLPARANWRCSR